MPIQQSVGWVALAVGLFGLLTSTVFLGLVAAGVVRFCAGRRQQESALRSLNQPLPPVSMFKPLHGSEPGLEENLRGFYRQAGDEAGTAASGPVAPESSSPQPSTPQSSTPQPATPQLSPPRFEMMFCARRIDDPGLQIAASVASEFPRIPTKIVTSGEPWAANAKVCSMAKMAEAAGHDVWVISDSDVRVGHGYLSAVAAPFLDPQVGAVTCLYRGVAEEGGIWARLEAVGMSIEMSSGVVVANLLEGMRFVLGPTMAVRRECVDAMGGFDSMGQYCSDDFILGDRVAAQGRTVVLSGYTIDHIVLNVSFVNSVKHQVRWMKSTRMSRPKGHFGTALTFGTPFGLLALFGALLLGRPWLGVALLAFSVAGRMLQAWMIGRFVVRERQLWRTMLLFPVRDLMGFFFWAMSYGSRRIVWRGELFELGVDGVMRPVR